MNFVGHLVPWTLIDYRRSSIYSVLRNFFCARASAHVAMLLVRLATVKQPSGSIILCSANKRTNTLMEGDITQVIVDIIRRAT